MIKTTELMLGNLVEYKNTYITITTISNNYVSATVGDKKEVCLMPLDINPIPLTEEVLKRINVDKNTAIELSRDYSINTVHELQIFWRNSIHQLNYTPLLSPRYTTHDGVEVWEGDEVWYTFINPKSSDTPQKWIVGVDMCNTRYLYFNFKEKAQSYIDSQTRKPIFTTEDGVDVYEGDEYWFVLRSGILSIIDRKIPDYTYCIKGSGKISDYIYFSTKQLAQKYLNRTWLKADAEKAEKEYQDLLNAKK